MSSCSQEYAGTDAISAWLAPAVGPAATFKPQLDRANVMSCLEGSRPPCSTDNIVLQIASPPMNTLFGASLDLFFALGATNGHYVGLSALNPGNACK